MSRILIFAAIATTLLVDTWIVGSLRVCVYRHLGGETSITVPAYEACPLAL